MTMNNKLNPIIFGLGNCGCNSLETVKNRYNDIYTVGVNIDEDNLNKISADLKILIEVDKDNSTKISFDSLPKFSDKNAAIVVLGLSGNTSYVAVEKLLNYIKTLNLVTYVFAVKPFDFEGEIKRNQSFKNLEQIKNLSDCIFLISNDKLLYGEGDKLISQAFKKLNYLICDFIYVLENLSDTNSESSMIIEDILKKSQQVGLSYFSLNKITLNDFIDRGAYICTDSTFLDYSLRKATLIMLNIKSKNELKLNHITGFIEKLKHIAGDEVEINFSYSVAEDLENEVQVSIFGTNYNLDLISSNYEELSRVSLNKNHHYEEKDEGVITEDDIIPNFLKKLKGE